MTIDSQPLDLLRRFPPLKHALRSRAFQPLLQWAMLAVFGLAVATGLLGTPAGNRNFGIIFVWVIWWGLLTLVLVPLFGRLWCAACPIPAPGEWLQRRGIVARIPGRLRSLRYRWPRRLKNIWLQNAGFLAMALFSAVILTRPAVSAWVLLGFALCGVALSLLFDNRVFCRYVCPMGGFIGLYSMNSPLALRVRDEDICRTHTSKDCITGNEFGYGCPWMVYPGTLTRNVDCGLCTECLKTCPKDNITLTLKPTGDDLLAGGENRLDEAFKALILLASALIYPAVLLGPLGWLKSWAGLGSLPGWALYAAGFLLVNLAVLPGLFWLVTALARRLANLDLPLRRLFVDYSRALIPLGLAAWMAFSLSFLLVNGSYALAVLSDPFGWGWNLFGTAGAEWTPAAPGLVAFAQVGILTAGLIFAVRAAQRIVGQHSADQGTAGRAALPVIGFMALITLGQLGLYLG